MEKKAKAGKTMKEQKALIVALCCCVLALCVATDVAVHFYRESREGQEQLAAARGQIETLETTLSLTQEQLAQAETEKVSAEQERDSVRKWYEQVARRDNPIDRYYFSYLQMRETGTTAEMSDNAAFYRNAWKQEFDHAMDFVEEWINPKYEEDDQLLADYRALVERQVEMAWDLTLLCRNSSMSHEERYLNMQYLLGTYGPVFASRFEADAYRNGVLWLLDSCYYAEDWSSLYPFAFDDHFITEHCGEENPIFPPLSQVFPD